MNDPEAANPASPVVPGGEALRSHELTDGALLAFIGGSLDSFTYLGHGKVFANSMTGNVVLLGIEAVQEQWRNAFHHLPPIGAFLLGVGTARLLHKPLLQRHVSNPPLTVLGIEMAILLLLGLLPGNPPDTVVTLSIAFAASLQVQTFRSVNGQSFNSTFTTGNLRTFAEAATDWFFNGRRVRDARITYEFAVICGTFLAGAVLGAFLTPRVGNRTLLVEVVLLAVLFGRIGLRRPA